ncbi:iron-sulfur cluster biosynthesis family protein [Cohnella lubricantis]|uniref:Iron-sulfur cluster biosynthesis family protein n=1 Tax=Cohnella lubricantis TaxID=2163172 RepID=A0A841TBK0_9BACL|nr:iron-sulfur cluster biosynthesis family protein [Cohnella lubricantis]MBB6678674.1 iron-sulfur cluster biosynthesis family protein [Cohnella lubricantis]MBP2118577.1 uncharacterized protein YqkB [Cohnella lubricantis]
MRISWSEQAVQAIREQLDADSIALRLVYDTEGCGCAVNGVTALWAVAAPQADDVQAEGGPIAVWYDKQQEIFWDEELRISYAPERRTFVLASDGQIYSNRLPVQDRRGLPIAE